MIQPCRADTWPTLHNFSLPSLLCGAVFSVCLPPVPGPGSLQSCLMQPFPPPCPLPAAIPVKHSRPIFLLRVTSCCCLGIPKAGGEVMCCLELARCEGNTAVVRGQTRPSPKHKIPSVIQAIFLETCVSAGSPAVGILCDVSPVVCGSGTSSPASDVFVCNSFHT